MKKSWIIFLVLTLLVSCAKNKKDTEPKSGEAGKVEKLAEEKAAEAKRLAAEKTAEAKRLAVEKAAKAKKLAEK